MQSSAYNKNPTGDVLVLLNADTRDFLSQFCSSFRLSDFHVLSTSKKNNKKRIATPTTTKDVPMKKKKNCTTPKTNKLTSPFSKAATIARVRGGGEDRRKKINIVPTSGNDCPCPRCRKGKQVQEQSADDR